MAIEAVSGARIGELAPDFTLKSLEGRPVSLSDYRGKKTIVFMWGSW